MKTVEYFDLSIVPGMHFGFTTSKAAFAKEMRRLGVKNSPDFLLDSTANATTHFFTSEGKVTAIVTLPAKDIKRRGVPQIAAMLGHEAVHVWQECKSQMRETAPGKEVEAYAVQFILQRMLECIY